MRTDTPDPANAAQHRFPQPKLENISGTQRGAVGRFGCVLVATTGNRCDWTSAPAEPILQSSMRSRYFVVHEVCLLPEHPSGVRCANADAHPMDMQRIKECQGLHAQLRLEIARARAAIGSDQFEFQQHVSRGAELITQLKRLRTCEDSLAG